MNMRGLMPWGRSRAPALPTSYSHDGGASPFLALHREMNRLFDDVFRSFDAPDWFGAASVWPNIEVSETDREVRVTAEVPGLDEKDVEVVFADGVLTIRGEKKAEADDKDRQFSERYYGRFERQIPLGVPVEETKANASFRNGVLTVLLPKAAQADSRGRRIPINGAH